MAIIMDEGVQLRWWWWWYPQLHKKATSQLLLIMVQRPSSAYNANQNPAIKKVP